MTKRSWKEATALALFLAALAVAVYGPHAVHGGFLSDALSGQALYRFAPDGLFGSLETFLDVPTLRQRPLFAVYVTVLYETLGEHMGFWYALQGANCVLMSLAVYLLLRKLDFSFVDAGLVATLLLVFPAADSLRLWMPVIQIPLSIAAAAFGFLLALAAFDAAGRRGLLLHGASLTLFAASLLLYEATLPVMLASVLLYRLRAPWRPALWRWAADCAVLVPIALTVTLGFGAKPQGGDDPLGHTGRIAEQAVSLLAEVVLPLGSAEWYVLGLAALLPAVAALLVARLPSDDPSRVALRRRLLILGAGLIVVVLGYAAFVPAREYYSPLTPGIANRVNAVAGIGWVLVLYALASLAATIAFRGVRRGGPLAAAVTVLACALIGIGWLRSSVENGDRYTDAHREGQAVLGSLRAALPNPPPGSTIWTFGQPAEIAPGIPVFGNTWDMTAGAQLAYDDPTLRSFVAFPGTTFDCRAEGILPGGPRYDAEALLQFENADSPYGRTFFVETTTGRLARIGTRARCREAAATFRRSPELPDPGSS